MPSLRPGVSMNLSPTKSFSRAEGLDAEVPPAHFELARRVIRNPVRMEVPPPPDVIEKARNENPRLTTFDLLHLVATLLEVNSPPHSLSLARKAKAMGRV
jgi:hypothetical protein